MKPRGKKHGKVKQTDNSERQGEIYVLHNLDNDKEYVGQTIRGYLERLKGHMYAAFVGLSQKPLYRAMRKSKRIHGDLSHFTIEVVWRGPESELNNAERRFIRLRKTFINLGLGYNLTTGGGQCKMSRRTILKMRKSNKIAQGKPEVRAAKSVAQTLVMQNPAARMAASLAQTAVMSDPLARAALSAEFSCCSQSSEHKAAVQVALNLAMKRPEVIAAMSKAHRGVPLSKLHKAAISKVQKDVHAQPEWRSAQSLAHQGHKASDATKVKMSMTQKVVQNQPEVRAAKSAAQKVIQNQPERKAANSVRMKGHAVSAETRAKLSKAASLQWAGKESRADILEAIRKSKIEHPVSEVQRAARSVAARAYAKAHPEHFINMHAASRRVNLGRRDAPEVCKRKSDAAKIREAARSAEERSVIGLKGAATRKMNREAADYAKSLAA
jgi:hypothetical protein